MNHWYHTRLRILGTTHWISTDDILSTSPYKAAVNILKDEAANDPELLLPENTVEVSVSQKIPGGPSNIWDTYHLKATLRITISDISPSIQSIPSTKVPTP